MFVLKLQELIHRFEVGSGARAVKVLFAVIAFAALAVLYDVLAFQNLGAPEAMDAAQVGQNLSEGKGFTTRFVRPVSIYLLQQHRADRSTLLNLDHPDLANPPAYPLLLAGLLKLVPAQDLMAEKSFSVARRDLAIAVLNQVLFFLAVWQVFRLAVRWFNVLVATVAAIVFATTELYWRFTVSGLSTILLLNLVLGIAWCLTQLESSTREERSNAFRFGMAALVGFLAGVAALTRYGAGWLIVPVVLFLGLFFAERRGALIAVAISVFLCVLGPWVVRNQMISGTPFGVATFAAVENTPRLFPNDVLQRSLNPELSRLEIRDVARKLAINSREMLLADLPRMAGSWLSAFFLAGLLVRFQNPALSRLRWFVVMGLIVLIPVQALGKTWLWNQSPEITTENLLVLLSPFLIIFGVGIFFVLLDSIEFPSPPARYAAVSAFVLLLSLPLLLNLLPPHPTRVRYPPYYPPRIQQFAGWLGPNELMMSDIPWAVAWYGNRQSLWLTLTWNEDFFRVSDYEKAVNALYLTQRTMDAPLYSSFSTGDVNNWTGFAITTLTKREVPGRFPLRKAPEGALNVGQLLLCDRDRWSGEAVK